MAIDLNVNELASDFKTPATVVAFGTLGYFYLKLLLGLFVACIVLSVIISCTYCFYTGKIKFDTAETSNTETKLRKKKALISVNS